MSCLLAWYLPDLVLFPAGCVPWPATLNRPPRTPSERWLTPGVRGIGAASFLADVGHEIPTALLPNLLTVTLGLLLPLPSVYPTRRPPRAEQRNRQPLQGDRRGAVLVLALGWGCSGW